MKTLFKTITQHLFVASTSIAALLHSMWTISHLLGGLPPVQDASLILQLGYWLPGLLVALSLDIGLLSTSAEIRQGTRNKTRFMTLAILSLSMFYLQSVYSVLHYAPLPLGDGIPAQAIGLFSWVRDAGVIIVPALMPISILLYSFGHERKIEAPSTTGAGMASDEFQVIPYRPIENEGLVAPLVRPFSQNGHKPEIVPSVDTE